MYFNLTKNIEKIRSEFNNLGKPNKIIIKAGSIISFILLILGALLIVCNHFFLNKDLFYELVARTLVKNSFTILAEAVIGSLVLDYLFKKN
ncbi:hypothetical protein [Pseudobacteroides cellulosolvens]|uniref:Uncharacterized protein n=1 Tax=Pseudobacteroides cellulosolvens ATCC 35603 = DSM 2933 TaxID=398512 RepID=A0A0L6JJ23_9FIRM|nr:hypothetical protein [Pseudobacteroides cellulosolvens]KNY25452.1 hypothetical protein Bccel_0712 [Pseudobacteroides cellulosolvens ATCC 35603 = DSM 2933]